MNELSKPRVATPPASVPDGTALLAKAWDLAPFFNEHAAACERAGTLTEEVIGTLLENGFAGVMFPRDLGGSECTPREALEIFEALSYGDGSVGWTTMAFNTGTGTGAAYLPAETGKKIFAGKIPLISGQGGPIGKAEKVDGGYILNGHWRYGSGVLHAQYLHNGATVYENGKRATLPGSDMPEVRIFVTPIEEAELLHNWDVVGLRATGSIDYTITDLFVPDAYTHIVPARRPEHGGDFFRLSIPGVGGIGHTGFALGVGRRVLDELAALARMEKSRSAMISPAGGNDSFHELFAHNEAKMRAARALCIEAMEGLAAAMLDEGRDPNLRETTMARLALNHVTVVAAEVCQFAYYYSGGVGLRESTIQRCFRDMFAGMQHANTGPQIRRNCGIELLGLAEGKMWTGREVVDPYPFEEWRV